MVYKQQKFISHSSGDWKSKVRISTWPSSGEGPPLGYRLHILIVFSYSRKEKQVPCCSSKGINSIHEGSTLATSSNSNYIPRAPPPDIIALGGSVSKYEFWGNIRIQCIILLHWNSHPFSFLQCSFTPSILYTLLSLFEITFLPVSTCHHHSRSHLSAAFSWNLNWSFLDLIVDHNKLWKILKAMGIPDHLTCLLGSLYAGQEPDSKLIQNWKRSISWLYTLSPCLFNLYAEYIMQNARLDELQAGIKIARRNTSNLRYADDTTLMAQSEKEIKSLLTRLKEESEKAGLKLNIKKDYVIWPHHFLANRRGRSGSSDGFYFLGLQNHCRWGLQPWN